MKIFNEYEAMDSSQERIAYPMERENLCGIAIARTIFHNNHGIVTHEDYLREIAEGPSRRYDVLNEGTDLSSLKLMARNFGLGLFSRLNSAVDDLNPFIENGLWPMIHRPSDYDAGGTYAVVYEYEPKIKLFFPSPKNKGELKEESHVEFDKKWHFPELGEKWFGVFYDPKKMSKKLKRIIYKYHA